MKFKKKSKKTKIEFNALILYIRLIFNPITISINNETIVFVASGQRILFYVVWAYSRKHLSMQNKKNYPNNIFKLKAQTHTIKPSQHLLLKILWFRDLICCVFCCLVSSFLTSEWKFATLNYFLFVGLFKGFVIRCLLLKKNNKENTCFLFWVIFLWHGNGNRSCVTE